LIDPIKRIESGETIKELEQVLEVLISRGFAVDEEGTLYQTFAKVHIPNGLRIMINPREYPPPQFRVKWNNFDASFAIETGELLQGNIDREKTKLIHWFHRDYKPKLIAIWNRTRPPDCPLGPIAEDT
jgi:hypothetical protein